MGQKRLVSPLINLLAHLSFSLIEKILFTLEVRLHIFEHIIYENMCVCLVYLQCVKELVTIQSFSSSTYKENI